MTDRTWIKVSDDPVRYEYGRRNPGSSDSSATDQLAYVEAEEHTNYFRWETYTDPHDHGAKLDVKDAQEAAIHALRDKGAISEE